eukprot:47828-Heterocapsa_arctica.AAC.1
MRAPLGARRGRPNKRTARSMDRMSTRLETKPPELLGNNGEVGSARPAGCKSTRCWRTTQAGHMRLSSTLALIGKQPQVQ